MAGPIQKIYLGWFIITKFLSSDYDGLGRKWWELVNYDDNDNDNVFEVWFYVVTPCLLVECDDWWVMTYLLVRHVYK